MRSVHIATKSKQYPLYLGQNTLAKLEETVAAMKPAVSSVLIISDEAVASRYLDDVTNAVHSDLSVYSFVVPSGEKEKSFENYYKAQTRALEIGLDRHSLVIALGGGMIGDLAGFVAATFMRGIRFIQIPTTLLAHDSAVGGKVAVNHPLGKNMIGAFHQPEAVLYNVSFLDSLPVHEWRSGFAEMLKHALIWDAELYDWLCNEVRTLEDLRGDKLIYALEKAIGVKAAVVSQDETEKGIRAYLNFGHTLGHAIEAELGYGTVTHGDAVAIGMLYAILLSERVSDKDLQYNSFVQTFRAYGFPKLPAGLSVDRLIELMKKDKKANSGVIRMVLMEEIGKVEVVPVSDELIASTLEEFMNREWSL